MTKVLSSHAPATAAGQKDEARGGPSTGLSALIYFGLALLYFLPALLPGRHIFGTDYLAGTFFFWEVIAERIKQGEVPDWLPWLYGGVPLFANPGSTFYPPWLLLVVILPISKVLAALYVVQFGLAGLGMHLLVRELGGRPWVALISGLAFQFTGILLSAVYAGHDGRLIVASLAPMLFFTLHRGVRTGGLSAFAGVAATVGFVLLSFQIQSSYYLLLAGAAWAVFALVHHRTHRQPAQLARRVALGLGAVAFGFALASVNFLPFLDYVPASPRGGEEGRGYEYSTSWSMPPAEIVSIAVPEAIGASVQDERGAAALGEYRGGNPFKLHTEYVGAVVMLLLVVGFRYSRSDRRWWFFLGLALFTLTIAFGGHTPLYRLYYELLPGTKRFRAPSISFFLFSMSLVAMAAITLERLFASRDESAQLATSRASRGQPAGSTPVSVWLLASTAGVGLLGAFLFAGGEGDQVRAAGFFRFALFSGAAAAIFWGWLQGHVRSGIAMALLAVVTVADLWIVGRHFFTVAPPPEEMFAPDDVVDFLARQGEEPSRVWVLPFPTAYRGHGDYLMRFGIEQAGGEHSNPLQRFYEYIGAGERSYVDWHNFIEAPQFMHAANIRYIISMTPLESPLLREVHRGSALIYENLSALPRAYLAPEVRVTTDPDGAIAAIRQPGFDPSRTAVVHSDRPLQLADSPLTGAAEVVEHSTDRVVVRTTASREALLVLADNYYQGWEATINGQPAPILRSNHTFRGVVVPAGTQRVVFEFNPRERVVGLWIYIGGLLLLGTFGLAWALRSTRASRESDPSPR